MRLACRTFYTAEVQGVEIQVMSAMLRALSAIFHDALSLPQVTCGRVVSAKMREQEMSATCVRSNFHALHPDEKGLYVLSPSALSLPKPMVRSNADKCRLRALNFPHVSCGPVGVEPGGASPRATRIYIYIYIYM